MSFLGHQVSAGGIRPLAAKVAAITKMPPPTTVKDLLRYLGMLNYYRRFLLAAAKVLKPLTEVLRGNVSRNKRLTWSPEMSASFAASKHLLVEAVPLAHPDLTARILVAADASRHSHWRGPRAGRKWFKLPTWIFQPETVPH